MNKLYTPILKVITGSRAYGFARPDSDVDTRGIAMPSADVFFGLRSFEMHESKNPDEVFYSLKKFVNLAMNANPNILELLFIDNPELILIEHPIMKFLKGARRRFISKKIFTTYVGYAKAQLHKIKADGNCAPEMSSRRFEDIKKNGYDTKAATHLVRLILQAQELITNGEISFPMKGAELAICTGIRNGGISFDVVKAVFEDELAELRYLEENSNLPESPDFELINDLVVEINKEWYEKELLGL